MANSIDIVRDEFKSKHGGYASVVFIITAIILFVYDGGLASLISLKALAFVAIGMFVAAIVVGAITYWIHQRIVRRIMAKHPSDELFTENVAMKLHRFGWFLFVFDTALAVLFTVWVFNSFFWA